LILILLGTADSFVRSFSGLENYMTGKQPCTEAGKACAEEGQVLLDGPDGVAISLTPDAAEATGHELIQAADQARRQAHEV
jgi:hypothetical protein